MWRALSPLLVWIVANVCYYAFTKRTTVMLQRTLHPWSVVVSVMLFLGTLMLIGFPAEAYLIIIPLTSAMGIFLAVFLTVCLRCGRVFCSARFTKRLHCPECESSGISE